MHSVQALQATRGIQRIGLQYRPPQGGGWGASSADHQSLPKESKVSKDSHPGRRSRYFSESIFAKASMRKCNVRYARRRASLRNYHNPANELSPDTGYDKVPEMEVENQAKCEMSGIDRPIEMDEQDAAKRQLVPYELDSTPQPMEIGSDEGDRGEEKREHVARAASMREVGARTSIVQEAKSPRTSLIPEARSPRASIASDFRSPRISRVSESGSV